MSEMWGIDVSHWTKDPYGADYQKADFVIAKLTNGASAYQYESFGHEAIKRTLNDGKLAGAYHYACGSDPEESARARRCRRAKECMVWAWTAQTTT